MKLFSKLILYLSLISGCHTGYEVVKLIPDNEWHNVYALQADTSKIIDLKKSSKTKKHQALKFHSDTYTQVRLLRLVPFQDLKHLPDTLAAAADPNAAALRTSDFGPQDISQDGSRRKIFLSAGIQLLSRSNQPNTVLFIKKNK